MMMTTTMTLHSASEGRHRNKGLWSTTAEDSDEQRGSLRAHRPAMIHRECVGADRRQHRHMQPTDTNRDGRGAEEGLDPHLPQTEKLDFVVGGYGFGRTAPVPHHLQRSSAEGRDLAAKGRELVCHSVRRNRAYCVVWMARDAPPLLLAAGAVRERVPQNTFTLHSSESQRE